MITEHLKTLEKEDARFQTQILELSRTVFDLTKDVRDMIGQMKGIEKRLDDKDKLIEATITLQIMKEAEKLRGQFLQDSGSPRQRATRPPSSARLGSARATASSPAVPDPESA
jgi:hypothetical protein